MWTVAWFESGEHHAFHCPTQQEAITLVWAITEGHGELLQKMTIVSPKWKLLNGNTLLNLPIEIEMPCST